MLSHSKNILQTLTGKTFLQDVSVNQLQEIVDAYPYFGSVQFLLAKKMFDDKIEGYENALQKTALHFDDVLLLHYNLNQEDAEANESANVLKENVDEVYAQESETSSLSKHIDDIKADENIVTDVAETAPEIIHVEDYDKDVKDEVDEADESINKNTSEKIIDDAYEHYNEPEIIHEENYNEDDVDEENELQQSNDEATNADDLINNKLSNLLKEQAEAFEKPVEETATLPIENVPHHRIDYFESQGIKLDPEKEAGDKLGTQLKRFTDWLKQMKRISPTLTNLETDVAGEIHAQNMAARSNDAKEIVTETMADVLIKQGKPEEAIAIYEKLSFSNPSKSAYFAAKIKELKPE